MPHKICIEFVVLLYLEFQKLIQASNKEMMKTLHYWPFLLGDKWIPHKESLLCKACALIMSLCFWMYHILAPCEKETECNIYIVLRWHNVAKWKHSYSVIIQKKDKFQLIKIISLTYISMIMSSNGNIFHVTGPLCGEFTGPQWIPGTKASDVELSCFLWSAPE